MYNVLMIGNGGRENALSHKISKSKLLNKLFALPGNPGIKKYATTIEGDPKDFQFVLQKCNENKIDLVVIGPEIYLDLGLADFLRENNILVFGPNKAAAIIESSKVFAKNLMRQLNVPTAEYQIFNSNDENKVLNYLSKSNYPLVIKADGLAAGKGVLIIQNQNEAMQSVKSIFTDKKFGEAGKSIVVEEFLEGEEVSLFALTDGIDYLLLTPAQDYKKIFDNDLGKNTGGMGSYSFKDLLSDEQILEIEDNIIKPILTGLLNQNRRFNGCLYCGLIKTKNGIKVIEFNCRFGDPETQAVLQTFDDDLLKIILEIADHKLETKRINSKGASICLVLASDGYPDIFEKGFEITGLDLIDESKVTIYHAGIIEKENKILTNGGRVLNIVSSSKNLDFKEIIQNIYDSAEIIDFKNKYYRKDIGKKLIK